MQGAAHREHDLLRWILDHASCRPDHWQRHVLKAIVPSFSSAIAKIRRREPHWILESSSFDQLESDEDLHAAAITLISRIHSVLALYAKLYDEPLRVSGIMTLTDDDELISTKFYASLKVNVYDSRALSPAPTEILSQAAIDPAIVEALAKRI
jgi:hypothetical protein